MTVDAGSQNLAVMARAIVRSLDSGRMLDLSRSTPAQWARAVDRLCLDGHIDAAAHGARCLHAAFPKFEFAAKLSKCFDCLPAAADQTPFKDDLGRDLQVVANPAADDVLIVFCGRFHRIGMSLSAMHRWFGRLPASLVYLRDFRHLFYLAGLPSLGASRNDTLAALRRIVASLGGGRIFCLGCSSGTYPALHYGLDLGAEKVVGLAGAIDLSAAFNAHLTGAETIAQVHRKLPETAIDLRQAYATAPKPPRVHLVYGEDNWDDRLHAESMSGLPAVTLEAVGACDNHNVTLDLIRRGQFEPMLNRLLSPRDAESPAHRSLDGNKAGFQHTT
jgi:hypothetical protein